MVLHASYLTAVLAGRKTVECRLSRRRQTPFRSVARGDYLWLKRPGGPVVAFTRARRVRFIHPLTAETLRSLIAEYRDAIGAPHGFYAGKSACRFATLVHLAGVHRVPPFRVLKRDRRGWVVLDRAANHSSATRRRSAANVAL